MATVLTNSIDGNKLNYKHTVTAQDVTDGSVLFDFRLDHDIVVNVQVQDDAGVNVALADAVITYPAEGQVSIADGAVTFALVADQVINVTGGLNAGTYLA